MPTKSKVIRAGRKVREQLEEMWRDGPPKLDDVMAWLHERGLDIESDPKNGISRSGLHRYLRSFGEQAERMKNAEQMAKSVMGGLNESSGGNLRRMLNQVLTMLAWYQAAAAEAGDVKLKPQELMFLAKACRDIESGFKSSVDAEAAIRKLIAAELSKKAAPALAQLDAAAKAGGLAPETARAIRQAIAEIDV